MLASPPASNMLSRAIYLAEDIPRQLDVVDDEVARRAAEERPPEA